MSATSKGLRLIGCMKLVSACLLASAALGLFHYMDSDLGDALQRLVTRLHLGPGHHKIEAAIADISGLNLNDLRRIDAGIFLYSLLYFTEGLGLLYKKHWAEYLTVIATSLLLPLEIYEIYLKATSAKWAILILNVIIVVYLVCVLVRQRRAALAGGLSETEPPHTQ